MVAGARSTRNVVVATGPDSTLTVPVDRDS